MNCRSPRIRWWGSTGVRQASRVHHGQTGHKLSAFSGQWVIHGMMFGSPKKNVRNNHDHQHLLSEMY